MANSMEELGRELRENNQVMSDVRENTELSASYLDLVVDTLSERLNELFDVIRSDSNEVRSQPSNTTNGSLTQVETNTEQTNSYLESVVDVFSTKLDELVSFMRGNQLDQLEARREEQGPPGADITPADDDNYIQDIMEKVKDLVDDALGIAGLTVGVIAAPFVIIGSFFSELRVQTQLLNKLLGGGLGKIFSPITRFFNAIANSRVIQGLSRVFNGTVKPFFARVGQFFGLLDEAGKAAGGFGKILRTAAKIGGVLGKIFYPITVLIGLFNAVTGFMDGYDEGGVLEGIKQGVIKAFDAIIGSFVRLLGSAASFIFDILGFDNFAAAITTQINSVINGLYDSFGGIIDIIKGIFTLDLSMIRTGLTSAFTGLVDIITAPINLAYSAIKDLFSFAGVELPSINFGAFVKNTISSAADFVKKQLGFDGEGMPSLTDIITGLYTAPYDLVRSVASWVAGKLGFDQISDMLGELSFVELLRSAVDTIWGLFTGAKDWIVEKITGFSIGDTIGNIADAGKNFLKDILRSVLPDPSEGNAILKFAKRAIPDDLYKFAGLDPKTGEEINLPEEDKIQVDSGSSPARVAAGNELQQEGEAQRDARLERENRGRGGSGGDVNVATNVQNNSNTTVQQRPSASSQPDNLSDSMMTLGFAP
jgi:hypothetical protein